MFVFLPSREKILLADLKLLQVLLACPMLARLAQSAILVIAFLNGLGKCKPMKSVKKVS